MKIDNIGFALFSGVFFAIGFGILVWSVNSWIKYNQMQKWPEAVASIETCRFVEYKDPEGGTSYYVETLYSYTAGGRHYKGDRIALKYTKSNKEKAVRDVYEKLSNAKKVLVRFNPLRPEESVLAPGYKTSAILDSIFAVTWLVLVGGITVLWTMSSVKDNVLPGKITVIESKTDESNAGRGKGD